MIDDKSDIWSTYQRALTRVSNNDRNYLINIVPRQMMTLEEARPPMEKIRLKPPTHESGQRYEECQC